MKFGKIIAVAIILYFFVNPMPSHAKDMKSYLDKDNLSQFIVDHFDLRTVRSSFGPRRISGQFNYFKDFGLKPTTVNNQEALFDEQDWFYGLKILGTKDYNDDGIEDVFVCFTDRAKKGSYDTVNALLLTRYNETMPLIALAYAPYDEACLQKGEDNN